MVFKDFLGFSGMYPFSGLFWMALVVVMVSVMGAGPARAVESDVFPELVYWTAVRSGDIDKIRRHLETDFSPNTPDSKGNTPLMYGVKLGNMEMIDMLLDYGAKISQKDPYGNTVVMWAASLGKGAILRRLIDAGADIDHQNKDGATPLIQAVKGDQTESVRILLAAGADPRLADYTGRDAEYYASHSRSRLIRRIFEQKSR